MSSKNYEESGIGLYTSARISRVSWINHQRMGNHIPLVEPLWEWPNEQGEPAISCRSPCSFPQIISSKSKL